MSVPVAAPVPDPLTVVGPAEPQSPLVFAVPHAGQVFPADLLRSSPLTPQVLRSIEDAAVDQLVAGAGGLGIPTLICRIARAYVDVNRDPAALDPRLIDGLAGRPHAADAARVAAGLGVIPRQLGPGRAIHRHRISLAEAQARLEAVHAPYHAALDRLVARARARFGLAVLIDWHSMPAEAAEAEARRGAVKPDMVLGDLFGAACAPGLTRTVAEALRALGYAVALNRPYAGGYVTRRIGRPEKDCHALQIEIDRSLYWDATALRPHAGFDRLKADLDRLISTLAGQDWPRLLDGAGLKKKAAPDPGAAEV